MTDKLDLDLLERALKLLHGRLVTWMYDVPVNQSSPSDYEALKLAVEAAKEIGRPLVGITTE